MENVLTTSLWLTLQSKHLAPERRGIYPQQLNLDMRTKIRPFLAVPHRIILSLTGMNLLQLSKNLSGLTPFIRDWATYSNSDQPKDSLKIRLSNIHPRLGDRYDSAGTAGGDYFHQDLWVARKIFNANPSEHWDIGSRIDGFIAHLLTFRTVNVIDIRLLESKVSGLVFHQGDVTDLKIADDSIESLSCLHAMEHVGLGRYGDPIDAWGCFKGMQELQRVLAIGGKLYFSVPIGQERVEFNAHRVFEPMTIIETFSSLKLLEFAAINEVGDLIDPAQLQHFRDVRSACGLFVFEKTAKL
jgi:hypothetical protein